MSVVLSGTFIRSGSIPVTALQGIVSYMTASNPLTTVNPTVNGAIWFNTASGEYFVCSNTSSNANEWLGSSGSYVFPPTSLTLVIASTSLTGSTTTTSLTLTATNRLNKTNLFTSLPTFTSSSNSGSVGSIVNNGSSVTATYTQNYTALGTTVGITASYGGYSASGSVAYTNFISGELWTWGRNAYGQLGRGDTTLYSSPVQVGALTNWTTSGTAGSTYNMAIIKTDGTLWTWGNNAQGQMGQNDQGNAGATSRSSPVAVGALTNWLKVAVGDSFVVAIKTDGTLWGWGDSRFGQLGLNDRISRSSPVQIGALTSWADIDANECVIARKTDGTLWTWGNNAYACLGQGDRVHRSSPVQLGTGTNWASAAMGYYNATAITTTGTLWVWGNGANGSLGQNSTTSYSSPVQVGALTNWSQACGTRSDTTGTAFVAIKTDGTLWTWGYNAYGQLGRNNAINYSSPVQVGALTNWAFAQTSLQFMMATKTDGTLWTWGNNAYGELGQNTQGVGVGSVAKSSPVQVGALTTWKKAYAVGRGYGIGIKL